MQTFDLFNINNKRFESDQSKSSDTRKRRSQLIPKKMSAMFRQDFQDCTEFLNSFNNIDYDINLVEKSLKKLNS